MLSHKLSTDVLLDSRYIANYAAVVYVSVSTQILLPNVVTRRLVTGDCPNIWTAAFFRKRRIIYFRER